MNKLFSKPIYFSLFIIFIVTQSIAQSPLNKKGAWGINFGLNYNNPIARNYKDFEFEWFDIDDAAYSIRPIGHVGKYLEISRMTKLFKIGEINSFNLLTGFIYNQKKATLQYDIYSKSSYVNSGEATYTESRLSIDIKFANILNLNEKYILFNAIGFRSDFFRLFFKRYFYPEYYLTYSLGYAINFKNISIMPHITHAILNFRKSTTGFMPWSPPPMQKGYFNLTNFGIQFYFSFFNNDKNEKD